MQDVEKRVQEEREKLLASLSFYGVSEKKIEMYMRIIENVAWMAYKLDEARETIKSTQVAIPYDNGGGQKGIRENPLYKGYEALWKSYMSGMEKIFSLLPEEVAEVQEVEEKPKTVLELIQAKHNKVSA